MSSITIENIEGTLLEQIKKLAIQAGASFRISPNELSNNKAVQPSKTLPPLNQAISDIPRGEDNEDIFIRDYPQEYSQRELNWTD